MPNPETASARRPHDLLNAPSHFGQLTPIVFTRHNRPLHTLWLESQVWFSARDIGRLIGRHLESHALRKLDPDQTRTLPLLYNGIHQPTVMINESAVYMTLVHHFTPENRSLRHWLANEVIAVIHDEQSQRHTQIPSLSMLRWTTMSLSMLHWQNEPWIRLRDVPEVMQHPHLGRPGSIAPKGPLWRRMLGFLRQ